MKFLPRGLRLAFWLWLAGALLSLVAPFSLHLGVFDAMRQPILALAALLLPLALILRHRREATAILLMALVLAAPWVASGSVPFVKSDRQITLIVLPTSTERALAYAVARGPDVVIVPDFSERTAAEMGADPKVVSEPSPATPGLKALAEAYRPWITDGAGGQGVFLRRGIAAFDDIRLRPVSGVRALVFDARIRGTELTFAVTHLDRPAPIGDFGRQAAEVRILSQQLAEIPRPIILAGDFNALPWSAALADLSAAMSAEAPRWVGTFPAASPIRLAIDQIRVGRGLSLQSLQVGPDVGSVHLPLEAVVSLAQP